MFKPKTTSIIPLGVFALLLAGCASTSLVQSWSDPQAGPIDFKKVIVFFFSEDEKVRHAAEDALVRQMQGTQGVAAYSLTPEAEYEDLDKVKSRLQSEGFDGAVVMRLIGTEEKETWVPGRYPGQYYSFYRYYTYTRPMVYDPVFMEKKDEIVSVETNLYSLAEDKLIWSGVSETFNPWSASALANDVARSVAKDLKDKGLIE